jgi:hypothetical protein
VMKHGSLVLIVTAGIVCFGGAPAAAQRRDLRALARTEGDLNLIWDVCGPLTGLKEVVAQTQLTVEGSITRAQSALREDDQWEYVYTEYDIDVTRAFRLPAGASRRSTPGAPASLPFVNDARLPRPGATVFRIRLHVPNHGRVIVDGGSITERTGFPTLTVGQHVIVSAYFDLYRGQWSPFGVFEVRDGRVIRLQTLLQTPDYESVDEFAAALANPPPTVVR